MKKREILFFGSAALLFFTSWFLGTTFFEMAISMDEAKKNLNPVEAALYFSFILTGIYAILFYFYWFFFIGSKD
ncbi:MAG: hypothetical protein ACK5RV_05065 [Flavobacterium sp.]|jgi:Ni,Fe-hydrogenase I cytochrome b subunit|uniref:hypothetical protein n=1 Tax=Flavobacterium sp. TaxID=239 RepID=UPI0022C9F354|nr:hypothetical protein [Flavobacterium sp.]MCZ8169940.1 hypothetical protein [Flavobacterium sp.]MCZ8296558.1 hypothetical protein [Flavobacterium sp.]